MRLSLLKLLAAGAVILAGAGTVGAPAPAAEVTAVGLWEQVDETSGKAESWFKITEHNGVTRAISSRSSSSPAKTRTGSAASAKARKRAPPCSASR